MADNLTQAMRSKIMGSIKSKNTKPEIMVRSLLHRMGFRFSLHNKHLPGKPDIFLRKYRTAIFVHGCFWHRHKNCRGATVPASNVDFWNEKFSRNVARDKKNKTELRRLGWKTITVWECELKAPDKLSTRLFKNLFVD